MDTGTQKPDGWFPGLGAAIRPRKGHSDETEIAAGFFELTRGRNVICAFPVTYTCRAPESWVVSSPFLL